ncbi:MAG TPA: ABC transporter substrate-binding protein [Candidatus Blautia gallistercoris]|uniref:ABC transporter substrate-binding protein n=1 Tax=Candidatus Blautia gallistercoris TaxID=2838490 RepID=A0A9D1WGU1_9FIRM|nr:ABC transporter substrate-binding protein [Candidatus Blautia gallistercoris]
MKKKTISVMLTLMLSAAAVFAAGCGGNAEETDHTQEESTEGFQAEGTEDAEDSVSEGQSDSTDGGETQYPLTVTDDLGNSVTIEEEPQRVISLSPANTETLFALGADEKIVGRTDYCTYPEEAAEVDSIGSYTSPNTELIISLSPDVIFASDYIDDAVREQVENAGAKVIVFTANDLESVEQDILTAGQVLNQNQEAADLVNGMESDMEEIQGILAAKTEAKSAFIDLGDYYSAGPGSLLGSVLDDIGVENVVADTGEAWPQVSVEKIIESDPDVYISLFTAPEELKQVAGLSSLDCIQNDQIIYYDGLSPEADLIQRAGPRLVEGMRLLAEQIYPELFSQTEE